MQLSTEEQDWLAAYQTVVEERFPGLVDQIMVFGSKARGEDRPDSDLDLLLVISEGSWAEKDAVTEPGYLSSIGTSVIPSFMVLTRAEWNERKRKKAPIWQTITRDGVQVL